MLVRTGTFSDTNNPVLKESRRDITVNGIGKTAQYSGTRAGSPMTVLAELFTNRGCGFCPNADKAINELMDVFPSSQLVMIEYHMYWPDSSDPLYLYNEEDNLARKEYYNIPHTPVTYFNGPPDAGYLGDLYTIFKDRITSELASASSLAITLDGYLDSSSGTINATMEVTDDLPDGNFTIRLALVEDNIYSTGGSNGEVRFRYVMRDMLTNESFPSTLGIGEAYDISRTFAIDEIWNLDSISVVVFVQNDDDKRVLQSAIYDFIPQDILVIDDDDSTHPDGYEDYYHELLSQMDYAFDGWTLNERGSPTSGDLERYDGVIWVTADTSSSTLTSTDQTAISGYLDNGKGSLFITGENIGADIGSSLFYQNYLHSAFITDDIGDSHIDGIGGDPISDPFFGISVDIAGSSPSAIEPMAPATPVFLYSSSGNTAGTKSNHDVDSKVVYFAFMYFEGTDSDSNKMILMENILTWMMDIKLAIPLSEGWNMVSIPYIQSDTSLVAVLGSISGEYDALQWYDSSDSMDPWKHHSTMKPPKMNDFNDITHGISFWINIIKPGGTVLGCRGVALTVNQSISLHVGWNQVGYPSLTNRKTDAALNNVDFGTEVDAIWVYNATTQQWKDLGQMDTFEPGKGYWIHSSVEKVWEVPL